MKKVLFLEVGRRVELVQAFREAALILGKEVAIYGEDASGTAPALAFCDRRFYLCRIKDGGYIDELLKKAIDEHIDLIIPTIDTNLLILAENKERFEKHGIKVLISSPEMVGICRDKNATSLFFAECGLKAPMPVNDWRGYKGGYPAFIKPKDGSSSVNAFKVENEQELEVYAKQVPDYIVQPFIEGTEYTVDIFADFEGNPIYIIPRVRLAVRAGEVLKTQICLDGQIIGECRKIVDKFKPCGPITVQLIRNKEGVDWFIEINPRFGGGAPLSMKAGARSAEAILKLLDKENVEVGHVKDGAIYSRFDQSVRVGGGTHEIKGVIFDLDDTLYPEKEYVKSGYKAVALKLGDEKIADALWGEFEAGHPAIDEVLKRIGREDEIEKCVRVYREHKPDIHLYDGVSELIRTLQSRGIRVGIITDGRPNGQRNKIEALGLERLDHIITDELGGVQFRKPCDIAFRIMAGRWGMDCESIVYIGDNAGKDFQAPRQLGMQSIWFRNGDGLYSKKQVNFEGIAIDDLSVVKDMLLKCIR